MHWFSYQIFAYLLIFSNLYIYLQYTLSTLRNCFDWPWWKPTLWVNWIHSAWSRRPKAFSSFFFSPLETTGRWGFFYKRFVQTSEAPYTREVNWSRSSRTDAGVAWQFIPSLQWPGPQDPENSLFQSWLQKGLLNFWPTPVVRRPKSYLS